MKYSFLLDIFRGIMNSQVYPAWEQYENTETIISGGIIPLICLSQ